MIRKRWSSSFFINKPHYCHIHHRCHHHFPDQHISCYIKEIFPMHQRRQYATYNYSWANTTDSSLIHELRDDEPRDLEQKLNAIQLFFPQIGVPPRARERGREVEREKESESDEYEALLGDPTSKRLFSSFPFFSWVVINTDCFVWLCPHPELGPALCLK